ncbi:MAG: ferritin-like domain-containing protein [Actinobacteria bacterium]|nr:ferritin-like domain-containing protein [Actinomycetota bacterium]
MPRLSRSGFLASAAALALAPSALADPLADADLAGARVLVTVELLLQDFYGRALAAKRLGPEGRDGLLRGRSNETEHLAAVSQILVGAGQVPATADDIDFAYPDHAYDSVASIAQLGAALEQLALGAYLGAVADVKSVALKQPLARIAACEAQHLGFFRGIATGHELAQSFPDPLTVDAVSNALDRYTS